MRRIYKLTQMDDTRISAVAKQMVKFVKLTKDKVSGKVQLEPVPPFWEASGWDVAWKERLKTKQAQLTKDPNDWRKGLTAAVDRYFMQQKSQGILKNAVRIGK